LVVAPAKNTSVIETDAREQIGAVVAIKQSALTASRISQARKVPVLCFNSEMSNA
jgi:hypothetical protein